MLNLVSIIYKMDNVGHVGGGGEVVTLPLLPIATMRTMDKNEGMARRLARVLTWTTNGTRLSNV